MIVPIFQVVLSLASCSFLTRMHQSLHISGVLVQLSPLQTLAVLVSLVSQLWLLNEELPLHFPSICHCPEILLRQTAGSVPGFMCFLLGITVLHWLTHNVLKTFHQNENTVWICCFIYFCLFLLLGGRITLVLVIHVRWKWKSSYASCKPESYARKLFVPPTPPFYSPYPTHAILLMHLLKGLSNICSFWSCVNHLYLDYFIHALLLIVSEKIFLTLSSLQSSHKFLYRFFFFLLLFSQNLESDVYWYLTKLLN